VLVPRSHLISAAEAATPASAGLEGSHGRPSAHRPPGLYGRGDTPECPAAETGGTGGASSSRPAHHWSGQPPVTRRTGAIDFARDRLVGSAAYALERQNVAYSGGRC
jgi:hypothetical protein